MKETTTVRSSVKVRNAIIDEMYRRGGVVEVGTAEEPGPDWDIYDIVADRLHVAPEERLLSVGEKCPRVVHSDPTHAKRNAWLYTMLVGCQKGRYHGFIQYSRQKGVWELTEFGMQCASNRIKAAGAMSVTEPTPD